MKFNPEHLPSDVFDLILTTSFAELDLQQQKKILDFLSEEDYEDMHAAAQLASTQSDLKAQAQAHKIQLLSKVELLGTNSNQGKRASFTYFWQAASILLLFSTAWFGYKSITNEVKVETQTIVSRDTIYIQKDKTEVEEIAEDVAEITQSSKPILKRKSVRPSATNSSSIAKYKRQAVNEKTQVSPPSLSVFSLDRLSEVSNSPKRNSKRYETLEQQFNYVSL